MILNNGVDTDEYAFNEEKRTEMRKALGVDDDCILLTHIGRFSYQKNQRFLLPVLGEIIRRGKKAKLLLIGSGEEENDVKQACAQSGLDGNVIFTGNVDNVSDYLQAADVFMLPSRYEGLPIVGVEAQAPAPPAEAASEPVSEGLGLRPVRHSASGEMAPNLKSEAVVVPNIPVTSGERSLAASPAKESPQPLEKAESKASLERATSSLGDRGARLELEKESQPAPKVEVADPRLEAAPAVASAPAAAPAAPSLGELSLQELKKLSPSERRKALGLTRRSGSKAAVVSQDAPSAPAPDPEATVAVESIPASASFSSLKASKLNGLSRPARSAPPRGAGRGSLRLPGRLARFGIEGRAAYFYPPPARRSDAFRHLSGGKYGASSGSGGQRLSGSRGSRERSSGGGAR